MVHKPEKECNYRKSPRTKDSDDFSAGHDTLRREALIYLGGTEWWPGPTRLPQFDLSTVAQINALVHTG
jgi:hypothetical protein